MLFCRVERLFVLHILISPVIVCRAFHRYSIPSYRHSEASIGMSGLSDNEKIKAVPLDETIKIVEFFSGIGGWSTSCKRQSNFKYQVVAAYDVNSISNEVYKHVYGQMPCSTAIESLSLKTLEAHSADMWVRDKMKYLRDYCDGYKMYQNSFSRYHSETGSRLNAPP